MPYNREVYRAVKERFEEKRARALSEAESRRALIHERIPATVPIDRALSMTASRVLAAAKEGKDGLDERLEALRSDVGDLHKKREELLAAAGYPPDFDRPHFECALCGDTGLDGVKQCVCFRRAMAEAAIDASGMGRLMRTQSFDNFITDLPGSTPENRDRLRRNLEAVRAFADAFSTDLASSTCGANLLMVGATGLGKTHLTSAAARAVIERGNDVLYVSASGLLAPFEEERFGTRRESGDGVTTDRVFGCDLLVIDDLGTEVTNQFSLSVLYNVVNTRLIGAKSMIVNTNLTSEELRRRYGDRIASRFFGEFKVLLFTGTDARRLGLQK